MVGGRGRSIAPTVRSSQSEAAKGQKKHQMGQPFMAVFAAFVNGLTTETLGSTGLEEVEMAWLHKFSKKLASALDVGGFLEMWNIREILPKGDQYALWYGTGCAHQILLSKRMHRASPNWHTFYAKVLLHRKGTEQEGPAPPTNNERKIQSQLEQRRKKVEGKYA